MKYFMFIKVDEKYRNQGLPPALMEAMGAFVADGFKNGTLVETAGLEPTSRGVRIRLSAGKITSTDGPFAESKEVIGGYAIVDTKTREEALKIAHEFVELHRIHWPGFDCECEVRALET